MKPVALPAADSELALLVEAMCDGVITLDERDRLEVLLADDRDAQLYYVEYLDLHAHVQWLMRGREEAVSSQWSVASGQWSVASEGISDSKSLNPQISESPISDPPFHSPLATRHSPLIPAIVVAPAPLPAPLFSLNSPVGSYLFSYSASAVALCVALFFGGIFKVSNFQSTNSPGRESGVVVGRQPDTSSHVARITGSFECRWTNPAHSSDVRLGKTIKLSSGFLELRYDTGAKVILQGPCVYRVDSPRGGFLEVGKLTAKVGTRGEGRGTGGVASGQWSVASDGRGERRGERGEISDEWRVASGENSGHSSPQPLASSPSSNPQSLIPNPLFTVTTPTAVITDLGTEFGVEVEKSGTTRSHVFKGRVQVRSSNSRGPTARGSDGAVIELTANQSASVQAASDGTVKVTRNASGRSGAFVRAMPQSVSKGLRPSTSVGNYRGDLAGLGDSVTYACGIDAAGQVVVYSPTVANTVHVFLQGEGKLMDLGTLEPGESLPAVREMAKRIATVESNETARAFLHIPGEGMKSLGTLGGPTSRATRINAAGQVAGYSTTDAGATHAFLYRDGKMYDLGTLGGDISYATGINASGSVVGASRTASGVTHAFLYTRGGGMRDLGALGGAKANSWALAIVDGGRVFGCSEVEGGRVHAFYHSDYSDEKGIHDMGDIGDGAGHIICCHDGRMDINAWPPAAPNGALRAKNSDPQLPDTREKGRTSP